MYLQPYNFPRIQMTGHHKDRRASSSLLPDPSSSSMLEQSHQLSLSQGNLLQLPPVRSSSPRLLEPENKPRSRSLNVLSDQPPALPLPRAFSPSAAPAASPPAANHAPPPTIMVEVDGEEQEGLERGRMLREDSEGSSFMSSSSDDFSFSDDLSSSSASSSLNLSHSVNEEQLRLSRTPPPSNRLSPTSAQEGKILPSVSDPNLYKGPTMPKVPPRPRAQEILTRCSTVTRKNAARGGQSPTQTEIQTR